jgi:hypothetical protein
MGTPIAIPTLSYLDSAGEERVLGSPLHVIYSGAVVTVFHWFLRRDFSEEAILSDFVGQAASAGAPCVAHDEVPYSRPVSLIAARVSGCGALYLTLRVFGSEMRTDQPP